MDISEEKEREVGNDKKEGDERVVESNFDSVGGPKNRLMPD